MSDRKSNRRDEKLEAHGISRKEWVAQAIALAGMNTGGRKAGSKRKAKDEAAAEADADDEGDQTEEE
jgi:hypothetical protein